MSHMKPLYDEQGDLVQWWDRRESLIVPSVPPLFPLQAVHHVY